MSVLKNTGSNILLIITMILSSCTSRKTEIDRSKLIPEDRLADIITDLYIADGLLTLPAVHTWYNPSDSIAAYSDIFEDHGYEKEVFDKTMRFYFIKRPKKLLRIYDIVLARLSEMESRTVQEMNKYESALSYLWKGRDFYAFPGNNDTTMFDIEFPYPGSFQISFTLTLHHDDQSINPRFYAYLSNKDSIQSGTRVYFNSIPYIKDDLPHRYSYEIDILEPSRLHLRGWLFYYDNVKDWDKKHYFIESTSVGSASAEP